MNVETRKAIRTVVQLAVALATAVPTVLAGAPQDAALGQVVVVAGLVTRYFYLAERLPGFPDWLKVASAVPPTPVPNTQ